MEGYDTDQYRLKLLIQGNLTVKKTSQFIKNSGLPDSVLPERELWEKEFRD